MKKVVVVYPYPHEAYANVAVLATGSPKMVAFGEKTFETKTEEEWLEANNTSDGCLIIMCKANLPKYKPLTLAVFKEWIYWENIE